MKASDGMSIMQKYPGLSGGNAGSEQTGRKKFIEALAIVGEGLRGHSWSQHQTVP